MGTDIVRHDIGREADEHTRDTEDVAVLVAATEQSTMRNGTVLTSEEKERADRDKADDEDKSTSPSTPDQHERGNKADRQRSGLLVQSYYTHGTMTISLRKERTAPKLG